MAMTQEQFESLVSRLEQDSARNPKLYKLRLGALAVFGYAYIGAILLLLFALLGLIVLAATKGAAMLLILKKVGWLVLALIWIVARSMWIKFEPPSGRQIVRAEAPRLFELIEQTRARARAPKVHSVLITDDFNAAVVQLPRLGIFGWQKNFLLLGLPLMQALSLDEFKAVLAHELGHLSGAHGKFGAWIYRLRSGWSRLSEALSAQEHWGRFLFVPFFNWFAPTFAAYSFVQARQQEHEADRVSAEVAGADAAGAALVRVNTHGDFLSEQYWQDVFRRAESEPHPLATPFSSMTTVFAGACEGEHARKALRQALARRTDYADTHPSLSDRLRALNVQPEIPRPVTASSARILLGTLATAIARELDQRWQTSVQDWWKQRYEYLNEAKRELARLEAIPEQALSLEDAWQRARLTEETREDEDPLPSYRKVLEREPKHMSARFAVGRLLLARDDEAGLDYLRQVSEQDPSATAAASSHIVAYLTRHGREAEAREYIDRYHEATEIEQQASRERSEVRTNDTFLPHELDEQALAALREQLHGYGLARAYLVRKQTKHYQHSPLYILAVERRTGFFGRGSKPSADELTSQLATEVEYPGETLVVALDGDNKSFRGKFKAVKGSLILTNQ